MSKQKIQDVSCVWFEDVQCPVRKKILEQQKFSKIARPSDELGGMMQSMMEGMKNVVPIDLQLLPRYCNVCHLRLERLGGESG